MKPTTETTSTKPRRLIASVARAAIAAGLRPELTHDEAKKALKTGRVSFKSAGLTRQAQHIESEGEAFKRLWPNIANLT